MHGCISNIQKFSKIKLYVGNFFFFESEITFILTAF